MTSHTPPSPAARAVHQALDRMAEQFPALGELVASFRPLMAAQAALGEGLPPLETPLPRVDAARLAQGEPLARVEDFLEVDGLGLPEYLERAAREVLPALEQGLPALSAELHALGKALEDKTLDAPACLESLLGGKLEELQTMAEAIGLPTAALTFIFIQLAKPLLRRRAQALAQMLEGRTWERGSCPICGSMPEMAFLTGEGGQRMLRCSLCGLHWRFSRTACPVCANQDQDELEFFYAEGREWERVDCCRQCGKYVVCLDARGLDLQPLWEVAALGLAHLDLLAQERGLAPAAWCAWNQIR